MKGLLLAAIEDPDPVVVLEPMRLYRAVKQDVPSKYYTVPIGKASIMRPGKALTIITYGSVTKTVREAVEESGIDAEILDMRSIFPFDTEAVIKSIKKTGRGIVVHEAPKTCGFGAEIVATINEKALDFLEAPILRVCGYDTALPFSKMELDYIPSVSRIIKAMKKVVDY